MTWSKKLDSRAYDPIQGCVLSINVGGAISTYTVDMAHYTVINDYYCHFEAHVTFTQITAVGQAYNLTLPLAPSDPTYPAIFTCHVMLAGGGRPQFYAGGTNPTASVFIENLGTTVPIAAGHRLRISGLYAVR